jgi:hypothetical protein
VYIYSPMSRMGPVARFPFDQMTDHPL